MTRSVLDGLRRRWLYVMCPALVVGLLAGVRAAASDDVYEAATTILLLPNDPAETTSAAGAPFELRDPDRYLQAQIDVIRGSEVMRDAVQRIGGITEQDLADKLDVRQVGLTDIVRVSVRDGDPATAARMANEIAAAYIEARRNSVVGGISAAIDELDLTLEALQAQLVRTTEQLADPALPASERSIAQVTLSAANLQYQTLFERRQELLVEAALKRGAAELVDEAVAPDAPASPRPARDAALGLAVGAALGLAVAALLEARDSRVRSADEAQRLAALPVLGELPRDRFARRDPTYLALLDDPMSLFSDAVRNLKTGVEFRSSEIATKVLVVVSGGAAEGKSMVAANLAAAYAADGKRTLVISADLRRPSIERRLGVDPRVPGWQQLAHGQELGSFVDGPSGGPLQDVLDSVVHSGRHENLWVLPAGPGRRRAPILIDEARELVASVAGGFDQVVIDTPPVLLVADARAVVSAADSVLLVVAEGRADETGLRRTAAMLRETRTPLLGVVVNMSSTASQPYAYGARRGYGPASADGAWWSARRGAGNSFRPGPPSPVASNPR